jgi:hypothetical protein
VFSVVRPITFSSDFVAYVDPALLPDDLVEELTARGALVMARNTGPEALVHLDDEGHISHVERAGAPLASVPEDSVVVDLERWRYERVRAKVSGALAGVLASAPLAAALSPVVHL